HIHSLLIMPPNVTTNLQRLQQSIKKNRTRVFQQTENIATTLSSLHIGESKYAKYPTYTHDELQKGIICSLDCSGFLQRYSNVLLHCPTWEKTKNIPTALAELITEYQLLFPKRNITTGNLLDSRNKHIDKKQSTKILIELLI